MSVTRGVIIVAQAEGVSGPRLISKVNRKKKYKRLTSSATHPYAHISEAEVGPVTPGSNSSGLMYRGVAPNGDEPERARGCSCGSLDRPKSHISAFSSAVTRILCYFRFKFVSRNTL